MFFLDVLTILCTGLMIGNELAVSLFVNPVIWQLEDRSQSKALACLPAFWARLCLFGTHRVSFS